LGMRNKIEQLQSLKEKVVSGGGSEKIARQYEAGKKTARERINYLFDPGTFREIDVYAGDATAYPSEGVVTGYGHIDGRRVYIYAQDFTVNGGSLGKIHAQKICNVMDLALKMGTPLIGLNDSGGARIQEGVDALNGYGEIFYRNTIASGVIPQLSVIMGPCAGGAVYSPALTDFIFMVDGTSQMFITGPQVIKSVTREEVTMEKLGGAFTHNRTSGVAHFMGDNELQCLDMVRQLLSFLPSNNLEEPPYYHPRETLADKEELLGIMPDNPNKPYDMKKIINALVDGGEFMEVFPLYANNAVTGFARINGQTVGIIANQPNYMAGSIDINASDKISRFIRFCDAFNISLVTIMDVPGFLPGTAQEFGGIIRHGAKILYAYAEATVPKITVITRKAYGGAYIAMCSSSLRADIVYAWPSAEIAVMGPEGAVGIINRYEIARAENPEKVKEELVQEYRDNFANPYVASALGYVAEVIDPRDTRAKIIDALEALDSKREYRPRKKHGNMPL